MALTPSEQRRRFRRAVRQQIRRRGLQIDEGVVDVLSTLKQMQAEVQQTLESQPSDFDAYRLPEVMGEVERQIRTWRHRAVGETERAIEAAWELGPEMVDAPLAATEIQVGRTILPDSLLNELKDFAASKITNLGPVALGKIEDQIRLGVLGGQSPHEVMKAVGRTLGEPGPFRFVSFRAETIVRTEMGRVHSASAHRRQVAAAKKVDGLKKQWIWSGKSRQTHSVAHGQVREVDEKFDVGGEKLDYPRDPAGRADNTINCGCESVPYKDDW